MDLILWRHAEAVDGSPDHRRALTARGEEQAAHVAAWLRLRLPKDAEVLVSPALRAQQTAAALGLPFTTSDAVGTDARARDVLSAAGWPRGLRTAVVVGHQPTLGAVAALLLCGREADWDIGKGCLWWLRYTGGVPLVRAVLDPDLPVAAAVR
jgi:phosphohistidine phosphatase